MVAIKGLKMPIECKKCRLMGTDGNPRYTVSPNMCIAIWAVTHETKHCVGGKILDECPLVEIDERKTGKWIKYEKEFTESGTYRQIKRPVIECSICHEKIAGHIGIMKYCPNCGAEMEGEE